MWQWMVTYAGHILISDQLKPHAKQAIAGSETRGCYENSYADRRCRSRWQIQVAAELGIDEVHSELLPADKVCEGRRTAG